MAEATTPELGAVEPLQPGVKPAGSPLRIPHFRNLRPGSTCGQWAR